MNVRLSIGTAAVLGLASLKSDADPTTAYIMDEGGRCLRSCAFCSQARNAKCGDDKLSRVIWPLFPLDEVLPLLRRAEEDKKLIRACIQVPMNRGSYERTLTLTEKISSETGLSISVSTNIQKIDQVQELMNRGAARVSIAMDAATEDIHRTVKGGSFNGKIELITQATALFPRRISTHVIVGLGESEEEALKLIGQMIAMDVTVGLFAFTPLPGTAMAHVPPPPPGTYRRVQIGTWLMKSGHITVDDMSFSQGRLTSIAMDSQELLDLIGTGAPFRTAGCTGCNRPYYNESPRRGTMFNYPRYLSPEEARTALEETDLEQIKEVLHEVAIR
ncbi:MAG: radical SAM protein [Dethiosulfovibrio peptidovorans]|nr:MAG: radical SAM protein [Dethiosulfovibrio peptidovorans]